MARVKLGAGLLERFRGHRLASLPGGGDRWKPGDILSVHADARIEAYAHIFRGDVIPQALGAFSYSFSPYDPFWRVGRYSSISWAVETMGSAHPTHWATTSPFANNPAPIGGIAAYLRDRGVASYEVRAFDQGPQQVTIGHDVWIGASVLLKRGVTIGDGAVVGARSMVTRDVPPYAVVAGTPARIIRYRFAEPLVERFERAQWWQYGPDLLQPLDVRDPEGFLDRLDRAIGSGSVGPFVPAALTGRDIIGEAQL